VPDQYPSVTTDLIDAGHPPHRRSDEGGPCWQREHGYAYRWRPGREPLPRAESGLECSMCLGGMSRLTVVDRDYYEILDRLNRHP
jgi:hypothetical protein